MSQPFHIVVADALMMRALVANDRQMFPDELRAFDTAIQGRRFRMLITNGVLDEYQIESNKFPPFQQLQQTIDRLDQLGRVIYFDEYRLNRANLNLTGLPQEHQAFIDDAIAAQASYLISNRRAWLDLSTLTQNHGLSIVSPARFTQLES